MNARDPRLEDAEAELEQAGKDIEAARAEVAKAEKKGLGSRAHIDALDGLHKAQARRRGAIAWRDELQAHVSRTETAPARKLSPAEQVLSEEAFRQHRKSVIDAANEARQQARDAQTKFAAAQDELQAAQTMQPPATADDARRAYKRFQRAREEHAALEAYRDSMRRQAEAADEERKRVDREAAEREQRAARLRHDLARAPAHLTNLEGQVSRRLEELQRLIEVERSRVERQREQYYQMAQILQRLTGEPIDDGLRVALGVNEATGQSEAA